MTVSLVTSNPPPLTDPQVDVNPSDVAQLDGNPTVGLLARVLKQMLTGPSWIWAQWYAQQQAINVVSQQVLKNVILSGLTASIPSTPIPLPALRQGEYAVKWYFRVTRADGVSSSLAFTVSFTDGGVPCSKTFGAEAGNTIGTFQGDSVLIRSDANSPISYATTYVSGGGGPAMRYDLDVMCQQVNASQAAA